MKWLAHAQGTMRHVLLIHRYAVKFPRIRLRTFRQEVAEGTLLEGFQANRAERRQWRSTRDPGLCPVIWSDPIGLLVIMPRAGPVTDEQWHDLEMQYVMQANFSGRWPLKGDFKRSNFGSIAGHAVRIDYGGLP